MPTGTSVTERSMSAECGGSDPAIAIRDLAFTWPKKQEPTLQGISLSLPKGCRYSCPAIPSDFTIWPSPDALCIVLERSFAACLTRERAGL